MSPRLGRNHGINRKEWICGFALVLVFAALRTPDVRAQASSFSGKVTLDGLLRMNPMELDMVYRQGISAAVPDGPIRGTALLAPGTRRARVLARSARLVWQGKVFEPGEATAVNRFFGMRLIRAQVYQGPSWLDGRPSLVLDYSQTSRIYANNRDEIRQVGPGLFLGLMYDRTDVPPRLKMYFALEAQH
jgi:hypothetical protein